MKKIFFLFLMLSAFASWSCGNYYFALNKEGNLVLLGYTWSYPFSKNFNLKKNATKLQKLEDKLKKDKNYMLLSDYSLGLMKLGKNKEALELLKELYRHYPGEFRIVSNLGTAYELSGQPDSALRYIRLGLALNPHDHEGSEWIHAKILETKLELRKNPAFLKDHTVLQLTEKQKKDTLVLQHLSIQLQERVPFTPAPDEIVASLFVDLGDLAANVGTINYAHVYYMIAKKYYGSTDPAIDRKVKEMESLMNKYASVKPDPQPGHEGMASKIGKLRYQELLTDNNKEDYQVDWSKINTDVPSLLAMVDYSKTPKQIRDSIAANKSATDELTLIPDEHDSLAKEVPADTSKKKTSLEALKEGGFTEDDTPMETTYIVLWAGVFGTLLFFWLRSMFRKRK
jgi:tetratricopeptide (TPR) repeat protein